MGSSPIKRSPELATLSREHHDGLLFVWKIRQGLSNGTSIDIMRKFTLWFWKEHTKPHFYHEEKILLSYLSPDDPMAVQMRNEHAQIRELIIGLDRDADKETFGLLCDQVEKHIRWEERTMFGYLEQQLSPQQLQEISKELNEHPVSCSEEWEQPFWVKK